MRRHHFRRTKYEGKLDSFPFLTHIIVNFTFAVQWNVNDIHWWNRHAHWGERLYSALWSLSCSSTKHVDTNSATVLEALQSCM